MICIGTKFISLFNFFRHYKSPPFHSVIRIHLISLSYHILVILPSHFSSMEQMLMLLLSRFLTGKICLYVVLFNFWLFSMWSFNDLYSSLEHIKVHNSLLFFTVAWFTVIAVLSINISLKCLNIFNCHI